MKIKGTFEVKNQYGIIISKGTNTITNLGKRLICEWLSHDNYTGHDNDLFSGKSLSSERFINYQEITPYVLNSNLIPDNCLNNYYGKHLDNTSVGMTMRANYDNNNVIFLEISNRTINCSGILLYGQSRGNNIPYFEISTTNLNYSDIKDKDESYWVKQKYVSMPSASNTSSTKYKNCKVVRFDTPFSIDRSLDNVKTIRIKLITSDGSDYFDMFGIGILEKNSYPNPPCVIGLGTSSVIASVSDTDLFGLSAKLFINKHKSDYSNEDIYKIVYSSRLNYNDYNDIEFNEIGLYFYNDQISYTDSPNICDSLFSRGVFDTPWKKTSNDIIDVDYCINVYSDNNSSSSSLSSSSI